MKARKSQEIGQPLPELMGKYYRGVKGLLTFNPLYFRSKYMKWDITSLVSDYCLWKDCA